MHPVTNEITEQEEVEESFVDNTNQLDYSCVNYLELTKIGEIAINLVEVEKEQTRREENLPEVVKAKYKFIIEGTIQEIQVRILVDTGSDMDLISKKFVKRAKLSSLGQNQLILREHLEKYLIV